MTLDTGLEKDLKQVDKKMKSVKEAIAMVEMNRLKFARVNDIELNSRKRFVQDMDKIIAGSNESFEFRLIKRNICTRCSIPNGCGVSAEEARR